MSAYLYLIYARGGELAGLALQPGPSDFEAFHEAQRLLTDQDDVDLVEVWRDARLVAQAPA